MDDIMKFFGGGEQLWQSIKRYATTAGIEATRIVLELYYVMKSPNTPMLDKTIIVAALAYQLLPEDLVSTEDFGILGFLDNGAALALAYNRVKTRVTPQIETQVDAMLNQWFGNTQPALVESVTGRNQEWKKPPYNDEWSETQTVQSPTVSNTPLQLQTKKNNSSLLWNDDDVVID